MGDATFLHLEILKSARDAVTRLLGDPAEAHPGPGGPATELLVFYEVNCAPRGADLPCGLRSPSATVAAVARS